MSAGLAIWMSGQRNSAACGPVQGFGSSAAGAAPSRTGPAASAAQVTSKAMTARGGVKVAEA